MVRDADLTSTIGFAFVVSTGGSGQWDVDVPQCPVEAIFAEDDVPTDQRAFTLLNAELARRWKPTSVIKPALPDAEQWARVKDKLA